MGVAEVHGTRADAYERSVAAAAEYSRSGLQAEFFRFFVTELADTVRAADDFRQVLFLDAVKLAHFRAPALFALADIIKQGGESGVLSHDKFAGHPANEIFLDVEPFISFRKNFGLVGFDPFVFPNRVFDRAGDRAGNLQRAQKLRNVGTGNLRAVGNAFFQFFACALVHIAHRAAHGVAVLVHQHQALHLRAERNTADVFFVDFRLFHDGVGAFNHRVPPLVRVLLRAAAGQHIQVVPFACGRKQFDFIRDGEQTGFDARCADIIGNRVSRIDHFRKPPT